MLWLQRGDNCCCWPEKLWSLVIQEDTDAVTVGVDWTVTEMNSNGIGLWWLSWVLVDFKGKREETVMLLLLLVMKLQLWRCKHELELMLILAAMGYQWDGICTGADKDACKWSHCSWICGLTEAVIDMVLRQLKPQRWRFVADLWKWQRSGGSGSGDCYKGS